MYLELSNLAATEEEVKYLFGGIYLGVVPLTNPTQKSQNETGRNRAGFVGKSWICPRDLVRKPLSARLKDTIFPVIFRGVLSFDSEEPGGVGAYPPPLTSQIQQKF